MLEIAEKDCRIQLAAEGMYPVGLIFLWLLAAFIGGGWGPAAFGGGIEAGQLSGIEAAVREEMEKGNIPGVVVLVGQGEEILYHKAFGFEVVEPYREPMSPDTIFDLASVSKPVGTATAILILRDRGKIGLEDPVGRYLPAFAVNGKEKAQIRHLLGHTSGLPAYTNAAELKKQYGESCPDRVIEKICGLKALSEPGETRRYSCLGYIVLGKIVEVVSGHNMAQFAQEAIFQPLGMNRTAYTPPREWENDIAATQMYEGRLRRGWVHDPLAQLSGGICGNAGLFSRAADLANYCRMLLQGGTYGGVRILSGEAVELLTRPQRENQAYGFEFPSDYSWLRDEEAGKRCFGHTGYTGTEVMCDPIHGIYLILLTNRVHPHDEGKVQPLRVRVAEIIAQALAEKRPGL